MHAPSRRCVAIDRGLLHRSFNSCSLLILLCDFVFLRPLIVLHVTLGHLTPSLTMASKFDRKPSGPAETSSTRSLESVGDDRD